MLVLEMKPYFNPNIRQVQAQVKHKYKHKYKYKHNYKPFTEAFRLVL